MQEHDLPVIQNNKHSVVKRCYKVKGVGGWIQLHFSINDSKLVHSSFKQKEKNDKWRLTLFVT